MMHITSQEDPEKYESEISCKDMACATEKFYYNIREEYKNFLLDPEDGDFNFVVIATQCALGNIISHPDADKYKALLCIATGLLMYLANKKNCEHNINYFISQVSDQWPR